MNLANPPLSLPNCKDEQAPPGAHLSKMRNNYPSLSDEKNELLNSNGQLSNNRCLPKKCSRDCTFMED